MITVRIWLIRRLGVVECGAFGGVWGSIGQFQRWCHKPFGHSDSCAFDPAPNVPASQPGFGPASARERLDAMITAVAESRWPVEHCAAPNCGAPIVWALTPKAKRMPVDAKSHDRGTIVLRDTGGPVPLAVVLRPDKAFARTDLHTSHFATCPAASRFRRRP